MILCSEPSGSELQQRVLYRVFWHESRSAIILKVQIDDRNSASLSPGVVMYQIGGQNVSMIQSTPRQTATRSNYVESNRIAIYFGCNTHTKLICELLDLNTSELFFTFACLTCMQYVNGCRRYPYNVWHNSHVARTRTSFIYFLLISKP